VVVALGYKFFQLERRVPCYPLSNFFSELQSDFSALGLDTAEKLSTTPNKPTETAGRVKNFNFAATWN
jgi:hypothetical protein